MVQFWRFGGGGSPSPDRGVWVPVLRRVGGKLEATAEGASVDAPFPYRGEGCVKGRARPARGRETARHGGYGVCSWSRGTSG